MVAKFFDLLTIPQANIAINNQLHGFGHVLSSKPTFHWIALLLIFGTNAKRFLGSRDRRRLRGDAFLGDPVGCIRSVALTFNPSLFEQMF